MTSRMVGSVLTFVILLFSVVGGAAQTYTQMQWGMNKGVTPYAFGANINGTWRDLGTVSAAGVWGIPSGNLTYLQSGAGAVSTTISNYLNDFPHDVNYFSGVSPNTATNSSAGINLSVLAANAIGGSRVRFPAGNSYSVGGPITLQKGVYLEGSFPTTPSDTNLPYLVGSRLVATANAAALVTQPDLSLSVHSMGINGMTINGNKAQYSVTNLVDWSPINAYLTNTYVVDGTGNCVRHKANAGPSWIDWYVGNTLGNCSGSGLLFEGSDSFIVNNYLSGSGTNITMNSSGSIIANNQIEVSLGDGIATGNNPITPLGFQVSPWIGNYFTQNAGWDIHYIDPGSAWAAWSPVVGNSFHASNGVKLDNNIKDALFVGDYFTQGSGASDITFTNSTNTSVQIIGTSHTKSPAARFANLPADTQFITGGPGGAYNRLQSLILSSSTAGVSTQQTRLQVHGNDTVLGAANVMARFGLALNSNNFDAALLIGSTNGNAPFLDCADGELTTVVACDWRFKHTTIVFIDGSGLTLNSGLISAGTKPTITGAGGTCAAGTVTGGALVGTVALTGVCAATNTLALTSMPAATTGYVCDAADRTSGVVNLVQTATTTTGATFTFNATTGATDVIQFKCMGY